MGGKKSKRPVTHEVGDDVILDCGGEFWFAPQKNKDIKKSVNNVLET